MLRPSPNHGTQRLPNDDDDDVYVNDVLTKHCGNKVLSIFPFLQSDEHKKLKMVYYTVPC